MCLSRRASVKLSKCVWDVWVSFLIQSPFPFVMRRDLLGSREKETFFIVCFLCGMCLFLLLFPTPRVKRKQITFCPVSLTLFPAVVCREFNESFSYSSFPSFLFLSSFHWAVYFSSIVHPFPSFPFLPSPHWNWKKNPFSSSAQYNGNNTTDHSSMGGKKGAKRKRKGR